jgi:hypothetical protein
MQLKQRYNKMVDRHGTCSLKGTEEVKEWSHLSADSRATEL